MEREEFKSVIHIINEGNNPKEMQFFLIFSSFSFTFHQHSFSYTISEFPRYFYSYQSIEENGPNNSELCKDPMNTIDGDSNYYFWFDTYPMEFAVFLLDSSLARGTYYHTLSANDAFYERSSGDDDSGTDLNIPKCQSSIFLHTFQQHFFVDESTIKPNVRPLRRKCECTLFYFKSVVRRSNYRRYSNFKNKHCSNC